MTASQNLVKLVIMYGHNFEIGFIDKVWGKDTSIAGHLNSKFRHIYNEYGSRAAFFTFFTELSESNQSLLIEYISLNFKG